MDTQDQLIVDTYHRIQNVVKTAQHLGMGGNHRLITQALRRCGIVPYHGRRYHFDQDYFQHIDTEGKAYFLGFLWADGNNAGSGHCVSIKLSEEDRYMLERFSSMIGLQRPLYHARNIYATTKDGVRLRCRDAYSLRLNSAKMARYLSSIGLTPRKTATLSFPRAGVIPDHLMRHFIRGCFDGDGSIIRSHPKTQRLPRYTVEFNAKNRVFADQFVEQVAKATGVRMTLRPTGTIYKAYIGTRSDCLTFLSWLYAESTIHLDRKHRRYLEIKDRHAMWLLTRTSAHRGISRLGSGVYRVRKTVNSKTITLGRFKTEAEALRCLSDYDHATT